MMDFHIYVSVRNFRYVLNKVFKCGDFERNDLATCEFHYVNSLHVS